MLKAIHFQRIREMMNIWLLRRLRQIYSVRKSTRSSQQIEKLVKKRQNLKKKNPPYNADSYIYIPWFSLNVKWEHRGTSYIDRLTL